MKIYGKYVDYLKVSGGRVLVTEVRPVPFNSSCSQLPTNNGATVRTDKWMELRHWQDLQTLLDSVVSEYEAATAALQPTTAFVGDTITRKTGQHVRIAYKWRENKGCRCFYLSSANTESSDSSSDDEDLEDKWLQKRLQPTEPRGAALSSWQPCGVVLVVSVAPHVPEPTFPCSNSEADSSLPSLSSAQPKKAVIRARTDGRAHQYTKKSRKHLERIPINCTGSSTSSVSVSVEAGAEDFALLSDAALDFTASDGRLTQPLGDQQQSNLSMDKTCEQLREMRNAKKRQRAEKIKASRVGRHTNKRREKYAVFDCVSSEEVKLVLSGGCEPVCSTSTRLNHSSSQQDIVRKNASPQVKSSSCTTVGPHRNKYDISVSSCAGINCQDDLISRISTTVSSFGTISLDTRPVQLVPAATAFSGALSLSQRLTETLDSTLPSLDGSDKPSSSHITLGVGLMSPDRQQHVRRDNRAMTRAGCSSQHLSPRDLKYITFHKADHLDSPDSLPSTLPSIGSTPVFVTLPNGVKSLNMELPRQIVVDEISKKNTEVQVSRPTNLDINKESIFIRESTYLPVLDEIPVMMTDVTGYKDELQSPVSPTQYNPLLVDPLPSINFSFQHSDGGDGSSDPENLDPVTVLSMAPISSTSLGNIYSHRIFPSTSLQVSCSATHLYNSPQLFDESSEAPVLNDYGQEFVSSKDLLNANIYSTAMPILDSVTTDEDDEVQIQFEHASTDSVCKLVVNGTDADTLSDCDSDVVRIKPTDRYREGSDEDASGREKRCRALDGHYGQGGISSLTPSYEDREAHTLPDNPGADYRSFSRNSYCEEHFDGCSEPTTSTVDEAVTSVLGSTTTSTKAMKHHRRDLSQEILMHSLQFSDMKLNFAGDWNVESTRINENAFSIENIKEENMREKYARSEIRENLIYTTEKVKPSVLNSAAPICGSQMDSYYNEDSVGFSEVCTSELNKSSSPILGLSKQIIQVENSSEQFLVYNKTLDFSSTNSSRSGGLLSSYNEICTPTISKTTKRFFGNSTHVCTTINNSESLKSSSAQQITDTRPFYLGTALESSESSATSPHNKPSSTDSNPTDGSSKETIDTAIADTVKLRSRCFNDDESNLRKISTDSPQKLSILKRIFSDKKTHLVNAAQTAKKSRKARKVMVKTDDMTSGEASPEETIKDAADAFANDTERKNKQHESNKIKGKLDKQVTREPPLSKTTKLSLAKNCHRNVVQIGVKDVEPNLSPLHFNEIHTHKKIANTFTEVKSKNPPIIEESAFERLAESSLHSSASVKTRTPSKSKLAVYTPRLREASVELNNEQCDIPHVFKSSTDTTCSPRGIKFSCQSVSRDTSASKLGKVETLVDLTKFGQQMGRLDNRFSNYSKSKKRKATQDCLSAPSSKQQKMTDLFTKDSTSNREVIGSESSDSVGTVAVSRRASLDEDVNESDEEELPDIHSSVDPNDSFRSSNSQDPSDIEAELFSNNRLVELSGTSAIGHSQVSPTKETAAQTVNPLQEVVKVTPLIARSDPESQETGVPRQINTKLVHVKVTDDTSSSIALTKPPRKCKRKPMRFLSSDLQWPITAHLLNETLPNLSVCHQRRFDESTSGSQNLSQTDLQNGSATAARKEDACTAALTATNSLIVQGSLKKKRQRNTAKSKVGRNLNTQCKTNDIVIPKTTLMDQWLSKPQKGPNRKVSDGNVASIDGINVKKGTKPNAAKKKSVPAASQSKDNVAVRGGGRSDLVHDDDKLISQLPDITKPCESADTESTSLLPLTKPPKKKSNKRKPKMSENLDSTETSSGLSSSNHNDSNKRSGSVRLAASESLGSSQSPSKSCSSSSRSRSSSKRLSRTSTTDGGEDEEDLFNYSIDSWGNTVSPKKGGRLTDDETVVVEDNTLEMPQEEEDPMLALLLSSASPELPTPSHLEPERMRHVVHAMRREYDSTALLRWLPQQLPWLTSVLRGTEDNEWHQTYLKGPVAMDQLHTFRYYGVLEKSQIRTITDFLAVHLEKELERALRHDPRPTHMYTWRVQVPLVATLMCRAVSGLSWDHSTDLLLSANRGGALDD